MKRLQKLDGRTLELSQFGISEKFNIYSLGSYDFHDNLDFGDTPGVYIFTKRDMDSSIPEGYNKHTYCHTLIYCGATKKLEQRFCSHFHKKDIQKENASHISICLCDSESKAFDLERKILSLLKFPINKRDNDSPKYPKVKKVVEAF